MLGSQLGCCLQRRCEQLGQAFTRVVRHRGALPGFTPDEDVSVAPYRSGLGFTLPKDAYFIRDRAAAEFANSKSKVQHFREAHWREELER